MAPSRRRVLFVAEAVTLAHVARANVLARALDPERFEVHAAWDPRYNSLLGDLPFRFHPISSLSSETFLSRLSKGAPMHDVETLRSYVREDLAVIERVAPDVIVGDFRLSLAASARLARVPHIAIANAYWSPYGRQTFQFPHYDYPGASIVGASIARLLFRMFRKVGFAAHTRPLNRVLREQGLPGIGSDIRVMYTFGDYTAYADIPELVPTWNLPAHHRYIGPVVWSPAVPRPAWWDELPEDRPVVYATPGSSGEGRLLPLVLEGLADFPVTVIAATAGKIALASIPANARVADFLQGSEACARASLVICNGGSPTTYQALAAGVPVLGLMSNNMDQHLNMEAVVAQGAGLGAAVGAIDQRRISALVSRMLAGGSYRLAAARLARAYAERRNGPGLPELLSEIEAVGKRGR